MMSSSHDKRTPGARERANSAIPTPKRTPRDAAASDPAVASGTAHASNPIVRGRDPSQRTERRQNIVEAAERVFAASGLDGATMRAIASEAGCTTGGIYPFFDGKDALYAEILQQSLCRMGETLRDALDTAEPGRAAHRVTHAFFAYYQAHPHELSMGLYLYRNSNGRKGLSNGLDRTLNTMVLKALSAFDRAFLAVADIDEATAARLRGRAFTYLVGLLILDEARRLKLLGLNVSVELDAFTDTLLYPYADKFPKA